MTRLLILACSSTKRETSTTLPASELYDGPTWRVLRSFERRVRPLEQLGVRVAALSAEHGLIPARLPIAPYDRRMDRRRAIALERETSGRLRTLAGCNGGVRTAGTVDEVFVVAGATYMPALAVGLADLEQLDVEITIAAGGIGYKLGALRTWLEQLVDEPRCSCGRLADGTLDGEPTCGSCARRAGRVFELDVDERRLIDAGVAIAEREADRVRRQAADDPTLTPADVGELVAQADEADRARELEAERPDPDVTGQPTGAVRVVRLGADLEPQRRAGTIGVPGRELGMCCNHRCRRFEYFVAVEGDVELATCDECSQRLVHESGLTWKDAAAAGYRRDTSNEGINRA